jgi:endonuclease/exonuclease/phosphatase family metal-dependent hydrolase
VPPQKTEQKLDSFYGSLEKGYDKCPHNDIKLIMGDFNAKNGQEDTLKPTTGKHSIHKDRNDNGMRLREYAVSRNMVIGSTLFPHRNIHKIPWKSPDGNTFDQIDHIFNDARHQSNLLDVTSYRGSNIGSDHFLIIAKLQRKISRYYRHNKSTENKRGMI